MAFTIDRLEQLLHEEEGSSLDFKRDQYQFEGADKDTKSELLKDILAFANTPRSGPAYILIGVDETKGGRSDIVGVDSHLDDAALQQFVNAKTHKPVVFSYRCIRVIDRFIGVIEIPAVQERPNYLIKGFGKIESAKVYLRRGSSTDEASPDEIAQIGTLGRSNAGEEHSKPTLQQKLEHWHRSGEVRFHQILTESSEVNWPVSIMNHHYQFSYLISNENDDSIHEDSLIRKLEEVVSKIHHPDLTWRMFDPLSQYPDNVAKFVPEFTNGSGRDVIEVNLTPDPSFDTSLPDFWRISPDGRATLIRAYREDRQRYAQNTGRKVGTWFSPKWVIIEIAELITHAKLFANLFNTASKVLFLCMWTGLEGRMLDDIQPNYDLTRFNYRSRTNQRITGCKCVLSELTTEWRTVAARLSRPVLRQFGFPDGDRTFVERCCEGLSIGDE